MDGIVDIKSFLELHTPQLILSGIPEHYWNTLCKKLKNQIFDSGLTFQLVQIDYDGGDKKPYDPIWSVIAINKIKKRDPNHIYLIDHAWSFKANDITNHLRTVPGLLDRMCNLMQIQAKTNEERLKEVSKKVWKFANTYSVANEEFSAENRVPIWYVMDELGAGILHSDNPNFRTVPFLHIPEQITYTLLFPVEDVDEGDTVTRNYVEGNLEDLKQREAMLIPWRKYDGFYEDYSQIQCTSNNSLEGHMSETLPELELVGNIQTTGVLKVYSEYEFINHHLSSSKFEIVNNEDEADILWYTTHFKSFKELSNIAPHKYINQFPFEFLLTTKNLLAVIAKKAPNKCTRSISSFETHPLWLPKTFNMNTELPSLVAYYMQRKNEGLDNIWICKPYNLARGLDTYITNNLDCLCRLPSSGPKIAQKYIENPVLFQRPDIGLVKFDIRYIILLKSVNPTELYVYNNFFLRFANKPFSLHSFEDYETHYTVMNYQQHANLYRLLREEFKIKWAEQYPNYVWEDVEKSIHNMFAELFIAATENDPPNGIAKSPQSRALYAADIMLSWQDSRNIINVQPSLLEINWMPDCQRACHYYPDFYNNIFSVLFLNENPVSCTKIL